ncbi:MAG: hypothetical protein DI538_10080 [Azospira oryzae]|jgi:membrane-associated phospholipid phosphatase|nr:MAG: hypothetical protein DI538_10080 [Azospira oryzae]
MTMHQSKKFNLLTVAFYLTVSLILVLISFFVPPLEVLMHINGWNHPALDFLFAGITTLGDGIVLAFFAVILLFYRFYASIALLTNGVIQALVVMVFKRLLFPHALRPISFLDPDLIHRVAGVSIHRFMTFPSGHTVTIFGLCVFLSLCTRSRGVTVMLLVIAVLVGLSRVYLLQHFLMDVAVGSLMGSSIGIACYYAFEYRSKPQWMMQRLEWKGKRSSRPDSVSQ